MQKIHVKGHSGSWAIIATEEIDGRKYHLLENNICGDEAPNLIVDEDYKLIQEDVWNGFDGLRYVMETNTLNVVDEEYQQEV